MPAPQSAKVTPFAGPDLLAGANVIYSFLVSVGMPEGTDVYHLRRTGWPIENTAGDGCGGGGMLIASRHRLFKYIEKLTRGPRLRVNGRRPTKPRRARRAIVAAQLKRQTSKPATSPKRCGERMSKVRAEDTS